MRDSYGFVVRPEYAHVFTKFAPIFAAEEAERCDRWAEYIHDLRELVVPR